MGAFIASRCAAVGRVRSRVWLSLGRPDGGDRSFGAGVGRGADIEREGGLLRGGGGATGRAGGLGGGRTRRGVFGLGASLGRAMPL